MYRRFTSYCAAALAVATVCLSDRTASAKSEYPEPYSCGWDVCLWTELYFQGEEWGATLTNPDGTEITGCFTDFKADHFLSVQNNYHKSIFLYRTPDCSGWPDVMILAGGIDGDSDFEIHSMRLQFG